MNSTVSDSTYFHSTVKKFLKSVRRIQTMVSGTLISIDVEMADVELDLLWSPDCKLGKEEEESK